MKTFFYRIRGALASLLTLNFNIGILFGYITGTYLQWQSRCIVLMVFPVIFFLIFNFIPESPQHFLKIGQFEVGCFHDVCYFQIFVTSKTPLRMPKDRYDFTEIAKWARTMKWNCKRNLQNWQKLPYEINAKRR